MKKTLKASLLILIVAALASCQGNGMRNGTADSIANNPDSGASTTVDTLPKTVDSTKTDTAQK